MSKSIIWQSAITLFVPINPESKEQLRQTLAIIEDDLEDNALMPFRKINTIHFIRWIIIDNAKDKNMKLLPPALLLSSNFDGTPEEHVHLLCTTYPDGIDAIYRYCKGYPSSPHHKQRVEYLLKYQIKEKLFWPGLRGTTREQVYKDDFLFNEIQNFIDRDNIFEQDVKQAHQSITSFVKSQNNLKWALEPGPKPSLWWRFKYKSGYFHFPAIAIPGILLFWWALILWILIGRLLEIRDYRKKIYTEPRKETYKDIVSLENHVLQNQFAVYGTIKNPRWYKRLTVEIVLSAFRWNGKYGSAEGILGGIDTIHFARWIIFNKGNNMMFMSNYDSSWENYFSEFVNRSSGPMNLTFGSMIGYPPIKWLIGKGAKNELDFKRIARLNQYPADVWYSGYPHLSAKNIQNNLRIRQFLSEKNPNDKEIKDWLRRF